MKRTSIGPGQKALAARKLVQFDCIVCGVTVERRDKGKGYCRACAQKRNGAFSSGGPKTGDNVSCEWCGAPVYSTPASPRRFCSRACFAQTLRRSAECIVCGETFQKRRPGAMPITCGKRACANEAKSRSKRDVRNPNYKNAAPQYRWRAVKADACEKCGGTHRLVQHHVVYKQHVQRAHGDPFDPDDSLTLCWGCHARHHHGVDARLAVSDLRPQNVEFAFRTLGAATSDYFTRYYDNDRRDQLETRIRADYAA